MKKGVACTSMWCGAVGPHANQPPPVCVKEGCTYSLGVVCDRGVVCRFGSSIVASFSLFHLPDSTPTRREQASDQIGTHTLCGIFGLSVTHFRAPHARPHAFWLMVRA